MTRVAFLGSPEPAARCLRALVGAGHDVALVVTEPDRRRGRGGATAPTPVKQAALENELAVSDRVADVLDVGAELGVVVAFGRLIRPAVLEQLTMVNLHFSLLPRWRGAAPVERALLAGDDRTGVCLMRLDEGLDTGPLYDCAPAAIERTTTAADLMDELTDLGIALLLRRIAAGAGGLGAAEPQRGEATYAAKITTEDLHIDWSRPARGIERQVRIGRAWTTFRGQRLRLPAGDAVDDAGSLPPPGTLVGTRAATGEGWLQLALVHPEGRRPLAAADWVRGARLRPGEAFA